MSPNPAQHSDSEPRTKPCCVCCAVLDAADAVHCFYSFLGPYSNSCAAIHAIHAIHIHRHSLQPLLVRASCSAGPLLARSAGPLLARSAGPLLVRSAGPLLLVRSAGPLVHACAPSCPRMRGISHAHAAPASRRCPWLRLLQHLNSAFRYSIGQPRGAVHASMYRPCARPSICLRRVRFRQHPPSAILPMLKTRHNCTIRSSQQVQDEGFE